VPAVDPAIFLVAEHRHRPSLLQGRPVSSTAVTSTI
jgi:hypothetical protein